MNAGDEVRPHLHEKDRERQEHGNGQIALEQLALLFLAILAIVRIGSLDGHGFRFIPGTSDRGDQRLRVSRAADRSAFGRQIDAGLHHTRHGPERTLDTPDT